MARMIPSKVSETTESYAERLMFEKISAELPDDWIALHSLGVAECSGMPWTEVDFVLIGPLGVYCLEVKGGNLSRVGGIWYQNEHRLNRSPFDQVVPPSVKLFQFLSSKLIGSIKDRLIVGHGVVTPDVYFKVSGPDIVNELVYDAEDTSSPFSEYPGRLTGY